MTPEEIPVESLSVLILSFGYISPGDYKITAMAGLNADLLKKIPLLKNKNPNLKVMIALGGWTYTDPGTWRSVFTDLVTSPANRQTFITNALGFLVSFEKLRWLDD
jgi:chitinase